MVLPDSAVEQIQQPLSWDDSWSQQPHLSDVDAGLYCDNAQLPQIFDSADDWTLQSINDSLFSSLFSGLDDQDALYNIGPTFTP